MAAVVDLDALERRVASMERAAYGTRLHEFPPYAGPQTPASDSGSSRLIRIERKVRAFEAMLTENAAGDDGGEDAGASSFAPGDECQARIIDADGVDRWHDAEVVSLTGIGTRVRLAARNNKTETVPRDCLRKIPIDLSALDSSLRAAQRGLGAHVSALSGGGGGGGQLPLSPLAKRILVGQREAELVQATDLVQQVQTLAPAVDSTHVSDMPASVPALEEVERRSAANMLRSGASSENVQRLVEQYAELMTLLNEKMVAWDETLVRCEQIAEKRAGANA